ncbi:hypothetical protein [Bradyrhizobium sp. BR 1432]|uniref:hypothetical protein n=1 Tax=Bradyrhizobium sp. BR 1432 TaxID=3447966 RepID=UPI003EE57775
MLDKVKAHGGAKGGPPMANRVHTHLKTVLKWWADWDEKFTTQPMPGRKPGGMEKSSGPLPAVRGDRRLLACRR